MIRGDTPHFDYVAGEASRGLADAPAPSSTRRSASACSPATTTSRREARAGGAHGNKGWDAALAALEMADLFDRLDAADEG